MKYVKLNVIELERNLQVIQGSRNFRNSPPIHFTFKFLVYLQAAAFVYKYYAPPLLSVFIMSLLLHFFFFCGC